MQTALHILTRKDDPLAEEIVGCQHLQSGLEVRVFNLAAPEPDYRKLLEEIFEADSVAVW